MNDTCPTCKQPIRKRRPTTPERARLFKVIDLALQHWPENAQFQPLNVDDLRHYLQLKAGHGHQLARDGIVYLLPKSISDKAINHHDFNRLAEKIYLVLRTKYGLDDDELLQQAQDAQGACERHAYEEVD